MPRAFKTMLVIFAVIVGTLFLWLVTPAHAFGMCGKRADFVATLNDKYNETRKHIAIAGQVNLVEIFSSKAGTWTIIVTTPEGKTCMLGAGNSWQDMPPEIEGKNL